MKIRFIDISTETMQASLLAESLHGIDSHKDRALERLGIERREDETHLVAWLRAMATENGLEPTTPAPPALAEAIMADRGATRFMWALA